MSMIYRLYSVSRNIVLVITKPFRPTQPGRPSLSKRNNGHR